MTRRREKGVTRIDSPTTHGWQARLKRDGEEFTRFYADAKHGGKAKAKGKAKKWRDKAVKVIAAYDKLRAKGER